MKNSAYLDHKCAFINSAAQEWNRPGFQILIKTNNGGTLEVLLYENVLDEPSSIPYRGISLHAISFGKGTNLYVCQTELLALLRQPV